MLRSLCFAEPKRLNDVYKCRFIPPYPPSFFLRTRHCFSLLFFFGNAFLFTGISAIGFHGALLRFSFWTVFFFFTSSYFPNPSVQLRKSCQQTPQSLPSSNLLFSSFVVPISFPFVLFFSVLPFAVFREWEFLLCLQTASLRSYASFKLLSPSFPPQRYTTPQPFFLAGWRSFAHSLSERLTGALHEKKNISLFCLAPPFFNPHFSSSCPYTPHSLCIPWPPPPIELFKRAFFPGALNASPSLEFG